MRRLWGISAALLAVSVTSCALRETPKIQSGSEVENPHYVQQTAVTEHINESKRIICKIRRYSPDSYVKSDMIFQADGRIYCGFYMQNEGDISDKNILKNSEGEEFAEFSLMDDKWLDACLSEDTADDFMLFGEVHELGHLPENELQKLIELISGINAESQHLSGSSSSDCYYYTDFVAESGGKYERIRAFSELPQYCDKINDENAELAHDMVMNGNADFFQEWEKLCIEHMKCKY